MDSNPPADSAEKVVEPVPKPFADPWLYCLWACFLLLALLGLRLVNDTDLGFHLRAGQWILQNRVFPSCDTFTYSVPDHEYLDIQWLYQVLLFLLFKLGGYSFLAPANTLLIALAFYATFKRLRLADAPLWMCALLLTATLFGCEYRFRIRPEILSWVLSVSILWVLELRAQRKRDLLFLLPVLQLAWANLEGLFPIGLGLLWIYCLSDFLRQGGDKKLWGYSALSLIVCLLNPYGFQGMSFPFVLLNRLNASSIFKATIKEFQPPWGLNDTFWSTPTLYLLLYKLFCPALIVMILVTIRKRKIHEILIAAFFLWLSFTALRNIPFLFLSCLPIAASCWSDMKASWLHQVQKLAFLKIPTAWVLTLALFIMALRVASGAYYVSDRRTDRFGIGLNLEELPVKACEFLNQNGLQGRVLNHMDSGGWLDWKGPQKTFIDARLEVMGDDFYSEFMGSLVPGGLQPLLAKYQPDILFFSFIPATQWYLELQKNPDWRLVYLDGLMAIYLRKGYEEKIPTLNYPRLLAENGALILSKEIPALIQSSPHPFWKCFWEDLSTRTAYSTGLLRMGIFCANNNHPEIAESLFLEEVRRTQGRYWDAFLQLGTLYYLTGRQGQSQQCMRRVLADKPHNPQALKILKSLTNPIPGSEKK